MKHIVYHAFIGTHVSPLYQPFFKIESYLELKSFHEAYVEDVVQSQEE